MGNLSIFFLILSLPFLLFGCSQEQYKPEAKQSNTQEKMENNQEEYIVDKSDILEKDELLENSNENIPPTEKEIQGLLQMREEEKLARDIYRTLGEQWNLPIFSNIAESEQTHMDAVKVLLEKYSLADPNTKDSIGYFSSPNIQVLYNDLLSNGKKSLLDALTVGAMVEDLDIKDLDTFLKETSNEDIIITYKNLMKGSRNHLRAFVRQIQKNGEEYTPKYISIEEYENIISSPQERGRIH